jgi:arsenate reductase
VLFLCTGNSARSQLAEALLRVLGGAAFEVASAGTEPAGVNPLTVRVLGEIGIDIAQARSKHLDEFVAQPWDYVITVCDSAAESCPIFPGAATIEHWSFADPAAVEGTSEERLSAFRFTRDSMRGRVARFASTIEARTEL